MTRLGASVRNWVAIGLTLALVACGGGAAAPGAETTEGTDGVSTTVTTTRGAPEVTGEVTVLAAASLTDAFTELGQAFEAAKPGTRVTFSFDASSTLAAQANEGAPADIFVSADEANMAKVTGTGAAADPVVFARNQLEIIVEAGNPRAIRGLADLDRADVGYVLCAPEVPCGKLGRQALDAAAVAAEPRSFERNVKAVVTKVTLGEVDAGIVYVTDVMAAGDDAAGVPIPPEQNAFATYPIAVLEQAGNPAAAAAFKAFVASPAAREILARYGFLPPA